MTEKIDVEALRALEAKATPGPWEPYRDAGAWVKAGVRDVAHGAHKDNGHHDAAFIAALRNAAPALLAAYEAHDAAVRERDALRELLEAERSNGAAFSNMISEVEVVLERGCYLVKLMHENDPTEPVADNGATVWDAALVDWAHWADQAMKLRRKL